MCSANVRNEPPYDPPTPTRPTVYRLSGDVPPARVAASVALAVLGEMLTEAEAWQAKTERVDSLIEAGERIRALHEARDRIAKAEAEYADGTVRG
jgi:hypothetical protein